MYVTFFSQTHLTEGQWSYINKVFFENYCRHRKYSLHSIFEAVLYLLVVAFDTQSVMWGNRQSNNGFDANKNVRGIKRNKDLSTMDIAVSI